MVRRIRQTLRASWKPAGFVLIGSLSATLMMTSTTAAESGVQNHDADPAAGWVRRAGEFSVHFEVIGAVLHIRCVAPEVRPGSTIFLAFGGRTRGSAVLPFGAGEEGSTVFLPFAAQRLFALKTAADSAVKITERRWEQTAWGDRKTAPEAARAEAAGPGEWRVQVPVSFLAGSGSSDGGAETAFLAYAKDLAQNGGWGHLLGCSDGAATPGDGDRYLTEFLRLDLRNPGIVKAERTGRLGAGRERPRIYQLLPRLFSNTNETRRPNGTLAENGVGKFNDINAAALRELRSAGFTHLWLTGVLRQITATDYGVHGLPADDPDLLKGLAGSPYAIKDYFDVCPDYAENPAERLAEFRALLARVHAHGLKTIIDFVPNHVARSYASTVRPEWNFGTRGRGGQGDDTGKFFDPDNNFFYLPPNAPGGGPPLRLPTVDRNTGVPLSPTCRVLGAGDGRFDGERELGRVTGNNVVSWEPSLGDWYETVKLNYGFDFTDSGRARREYPHGTAASDRRKPVPDTWRKMDAVLAHWQALGVDGFRCDMAHMIPPEFWHWALDRARERQPDVFFVAEAYDNDPAKVPGSDPVLAGLNDGRGNVMFDLLNAGFNAVYDDPSYKVLKRLYEEGAWANDLDAAHGGSDGAREFIFQNSLRYAENHDEVRLAAPSQWGGIGPDVGKPVSAILFGLSRGPAMVYSGQEVGEPALGEEGFGGDDARTTIFDYWSMPELVKWVNGGRFDGGRLSDAQRALQAFYGRLLRVVGEPAFAAGEFFPLNASNRENPRFGRLGGETASGHWLYAFLRHDRASGQRMLVVVNLHRHETMRDVEVRFSHDATAFLGLSQERGNRLTALRERLDAAGESPAVTATIDPVTQLHSVTLPHLPPLTPCIFELTAE